MYVCSLYDGGENKKRLEKEERHRPDGPPDRARVLVFGAQD